MFSLTGFRITNGDTPEDPAVPRGAAIHVAISGSSGVALQRNAISGFRLSSTGASGAVVQITLSGRSTLGFRETALEDNQVVAPTVLGGAFRAWVRESAALSMVQNTIKRNVLRSTTTPGTGQAAGADLRAQDSSTVRLDKKLVH
jgi:hypothetical protein